MKYTPSKYVKAAKSLQEQGYAIVRGIGEEKPDIHAIKSIWHETGYLNLVIDYDWKRGTGYFFVKEHYEDLWRDVIPDSVKSFDQYDSGKFRKPKS